MLVGHNERFESGAGPGAEVKEIFANGEERCEVRWPQCAERISSPVKDWQQVRDAKLNADSTTGEAVLSFTRKNAARRCK